MLEPLAGISTLVFIVASAIVGTRLLVLARQTRGLPEFALGFGFRIIVAVGYPLTLAGRAIVGESPELGRWLGAAAAVPMGLGWSAVWVFTLKVFRPESGVSQWLVRGALASMWLLIFSCIHYALTIADPTEISYADFRVVGTSFLALLSYLWAAIESFRYWAQMRRRTALGLAEPVVTNRFLLFGWVMVFSVIAGGAQTVAGFFGVEPLESPIVLMTAALSGLFCGLTLWFAFVPPQSYLERIRAAQTRA